MKVEVICRECGGLGKIWDDDGVTYDSCWECGGSGKEEIEIPNDPKGEISCET